MEQATILVVDDEQGIREILEEYLTAHGYRVVAAASAEAARALLETESAVDMILTDVNMGAMSGIELCARLKGDTRWQFTPVVLLTAVSDLNARVAGLAAGADDFFAKPVEFIELRTRVAALLHVKALLDEKIAAASRRGSPSPVILPQEHIPVSLLGAAPSQEPRTVRPLDIAPSQEQRTVQLLDTATADAGMLLAERYRVIRCVGHGGFGTVILAEDTIVHELLILKFLHPHIAADAHMIERFIRELRYARRVTHENVIRLYDFVQIGHTYAIAMEYFPSHTLQAEIPSQTPLPLHRGLSIIGQICRGMHAAHQAQVIHRDLKPLNVLINDAGIVKIVDFGIAAVVSDPATGMTQTGTLSGTPQYMAPEQGQHGPIDARTDIYSLGVIMYELFTERQPYRGETPLAILQQHMQGNATPPRQLNAHLPPVLDAIIRKAMAVDPAQRFQSMEALQQSLQPLLTPQTP